MADWQNPCKSLLERIENTCLNDDQVLQRKTMTVQTLNSDEAFQSMMTLYYEYIIHTQ